MTDEVEVQVETPEFVPTPLDNVMSGEPVAEPAEEAKAETAEEVKAEEPKAEEPADDPKAEEPKEEPKEETTVPLAALKAERQERQDLQRRLDAKDNPVEEPEKKDFFDDPEGAIENLKTEMRTESDTKMLEMMMDLTIETVGEDEFNTKTSIFNDAAAKDPSLLAKISQSKNPILAAYKEGKRLEAFQEIGDDPTAYKAKLKADALEEARAELKADAETTKAAEKAEVDKVRDSLPVDIANENSSGVRGNGFTGPTPLDAIL